jgi:L-threonylcarbamoyladenylate synthase
MNRKYIDYAVELIKNGQIIILPTDTLYGFSFDARNSITIEKFNKLKKRNNPLSIIVNSFDMAVEYAEIDNENIFKRLLPGPFTLLYKKKSNTNLSKLVTLNSDLIGIRIPKYDFLLNIVNKLNYPITTTSVNIHGEKALKKISDIKNKFPNIECFSDGDLISAGSTIINFTVNPPIIVRQGDGIYKI